MESIPNTTFDPLGMNFEGWYWYSEGIAAPTIWDAAAKVRAHRGKRFLARDRGRQRHPLQRSGVLARAEKPPTIPEVAAHGEPLPGPLVAEIAKDAGPYNVDLDDAIPGDLARTRYAAWILRHGKPQLMMVHLAALDHLQHRLRDHFGPESNSTLEQIDQMVGELEDAMHASCCRTMLICIVSDHGFYGHRPQSPT